MFNTSAIFMIKRPNNNMLYGNYVNDPKPASHSAIYIPGKRENSQGLSLLKSTYVENYTEQAYDYFQRSAKLGFTEGQINLGQMYLNGKFVNKDMRRALFWFNKAALRSNKAAVLKYVIVCRQLDECREGEFYQSLNDAGVNIKVRAFDFTLN
jgi:TPR repeat protein